MALDVNAILAEIEFEINRLQSIRAALTNSTFAGATVTIGKKRGRPPGSKNAAPSSAKKAKRQLTPEVRKRIADAMKERWAAKKTA